MTEVLIIYKIIPLFWRANQWTGFYVMEFSVIKELNYQSSLYKFSRREVPCEKKLFLKNFIKFTGKRLALCLVAASR